MYVYVVSRVNFCRLWLSDTSYTAKVPEVNMKSPPRNKKVFIQLSAPHTDPERHNNTYRHRQTERERDGQTDEQTTVSCQ